MKKITNFLYVEEINSTAYKKIHRIYIAKKTGKCPHCPFHNGENFGKRAYRSWKSRRPTQYKNGNSRQSLKMAWWE